MSDWLEAKQYATTTFWLASLIIPALIFFVGNQFRNRGEILLHAALATGFNWAFVIAYAVAAQELPGSPINGAAMTFVFLFGWVLPTIIVALCCVSHWLWTMTMNGSHFSNTGVSSHFKRESKLMIALPVLIITIGLLAGIFGPQILKYLLK